MRRAIPATSSRVRNLSLIHENGGKYVRMAHLAALGSHAINGVAELHTELLKTNVLRDFYELTPEKFRNKTNGVTPRRWMVLSNPRLAHLLTSRLGPGWIHDLDKLRRLEPMVDDPELLREWRAIKLHNKLELSAYMQDRVGIATDPASMFDVLVKRLHEYKRQHLQILHILTLYKRIQHNPELDMVPRTFIFGGKAAPGYHMAKLIIKLIHSIGEVINADPHRARTAEGRLPAQLQRQGGPARVPGGRPVRADFARRQGGLGHRQHEVRHERRAHHRHPRRRQHGDSRRSGRGELLPLRPHRRRGAAASSPRATSRACPTR